MGKVAGGMTCERDIEIALRHGLAACDLMDKLIPQQDLHLCECRLGERCEVLDALGGVLCRCTGYTKIVQAVLKVGKEKHSASIHKSTSCVGTRMAKVDGIKKIKGEEIFGADFVPEGSLWLRAILSPHSRAKFYLDNTEIISQKFPGIIKVLTATDIPGNNGFGIYPHIKDQPVLAKDHVRYRGEAVLALVGEKESIESLNEEDLGLIWEPLDAIRGWDSSLSGEFEPPS